MRFSDYVNCGTLLGFLGVLVFLILAIVLFQVLCYGPGGLVPTPGGRWTG